MFANSLSCVRAALFAVAGVTALAASAGAATLENHETFTAVVVDAIVSPRPVDGADGRTHWVYELSFVNETSLASRVDGIEALDADTGAVLGEWKGEALAAIFRLNGREPGQTLAPGHSAYAFLDASVPRGAPAPKAIKHRITVTRFMASPKNEHKTLPLDPKFGIPAQATFEGVRVEVDPRKAVVIDPPLKGRGWIDVNGCCGSLQHRAGIMAFNGAPKIAERFAIDFMQLDPSHRLFVGPRHRNESYPTYGNPVYAVADGTVVEAVDGAAERTPFTSREPATVDSAAGNHIVLDIGGGNFALYAHIKTGTVAVKPGDRVKSGDVIAHAGDTGNSDGPHLHFHIMDGPSPLASNGLPYAFTAFTGAGRLAQGSSNADALMNGAPAAIDAGWNAGPHSAELPMDGEVVDFPDR